MPSGGGEARASVATEGRGGGGVSATPNTARGSRTRRASTNRVAVHDRGEWGQGESGAALGITPAYVGTGAAAAAGRGTAGARVSGCPWRRVDIQLVVSAGCRAQVLAVGGRPAGFGNGFLLEQWQRPPTYSAAAWGVLVGNLPRVLACRAFLPNPQPRVAAGTPRSPSRVGRPCAADTTASACARRFTSKCHVHVC